MFRRRLLGTLTTFLFVKQFVSVSNPFTASHEIETSKRTQKHPRITILHSKLHSFARISLIKPACNNYTAERFPYIATAAREFRSLRLNRIHFTLRTPLAPQLITIDSRRLSYKIAISSPRTESRRNFKLHCDTGW